MRLRSSCSSSSNSRTLLHFTAPPLQLVSHRSRIMACCTLRRPPAYLCSHPTPCLTLRTASNPISCKVVVCLCHNNKHKHSYTASLTTHFPSAKRTPSSSHLNYHSSSSSSRSTSIWWRTCILRVRPSSHLHYRRPHRLPFRPDFRSVSYRSSSFFKR